jgi:glutamine synthetase
MISFKDYKDIQAFIQKENVKTIDLKFIDLLGSWRHITIPARALTQTSLKSGYGIDGSSVFSSKKVTQGDMNIIPDINSAFIDPFWEDPCLTFICNLTEIKSGQYSDLDPRGITRRAEAFLAKQDFADTLFISPELEFYLLDEVEWHNTDVSAGFRIGSHQSSPPSMMNDPEELVRSRVHRQSGYLIAPPQDSNYLVRQDICNLLEEMDIKVKYHHHEVGSCSQEEIEFEFHPLLLACDSAWIAKYVIKNMAIENGMIATFMPKPIANQAGSGMHIHMYLRKGDKPVFWDEKGYAHMSDIGLSFMAGIMSHGRALMALVSASVNSYRRLKPGFETPTSFYFSESNREAALRIPGYADTPETKRFEFRPSDATGNIYLSTAALLMAGIDGIKKKLNPTELGFGPFDGPGPKLPFKTENIRLFIPRTFEQALYALNDDMDFLLEGDVFSREIIKSYIEYKWENEVLELWGRPNPYEYDLYFDL